MKIGTVKEKMDIPATVVVSLRDRLIHGTKWSTIGAIVAQGLGLLSSILVAQFIGKEAFGKYGIIQSTIAMFGVFAGMAMGITATKHVAEFRTSNPARAGRFVGIPIILGFWSSLFVSLILVVFARPISTYILAEPSLTSLIWISAPLLLLNTLNGVQTAAIAGLESFKVLTIANAAIGIVTFPCVILGVLGWGLTGAIAGTVASRIIAYLVLQFYLNKECGNHGIPISYHGLHQEWHTIWNFSLPTLLAGTIIGPATWICNIMLVNMPGGYGQMGIFNATLQWQSAVRFIPIRILDVSLPVLSNLYGNRDFSRYYRVLKISLWSITGATLCVTIPLIFFSKSIMRVFGKDFTEGFSVLNLMLIVAVLHMIARILSQVAQSRGKAWMDFIFCSILSAAMLIAWLLLKHYGAYGLAMATCIGYLVMIFGLCIYTIKQYLKDNNLSTLKLRQNKLL
jgi:O-antigen/teichoic acid export membrane protein